MKIHRLFLFVLLFACSAAAQAASVVLSDPDCREILEKYATDPKSVPRQLVDDCLEQLADSTAPAAAPPPVAAAEDPCTGPDAASSVFCWGPWAALAPAGGSEPMPATAVDLTDFNERPEVLAIENQLEPDEPAVIVPGCSPGASCGFATVVDGTSGIAPAEETAIERFDLAADGTEFTVAPGEAGEIASVAGMTTNFTDRPDQVENMRAAGLDSDHASILVARVLRVNGDITIAADIWADGDIATGEAQSGFFAWGRAMSQADLDALNGAAAPRSLNFTGPMSVDNSTVASITVNFGAQPDWNGNWTNPAYSFDAGGAISGVDLVSTADRFSGNVLPDSIVQGALLGTDGGRAISHAIDVNLQNVGRIRDVGLATEVAAPSGP